MWTRQADLLQCVYVSLSWGHANPTAAEDPPDSRLCAIELCHGRLRA